MPLIPLIEKNKVVSSEITEVTACGVSIILVVDNDRPKAYNGICPHQGASLSDGMIKDGNIVCAMHQMKFSCKDGTNEKQKECLISYSLSEKDGMLYVKSEDIHPTSATEQQNLIHYKDLPTPKGVPVLGHLPQFKATKKHLVLENWANELGDKYRINLAGKKIMVSADPDLNIQMQKARPGQFRRYYKIQEIMEEMGIFGTFNLEGDQWAMHRKLTQEALSQKNVTGFFPTTVEMTKRLYKRWNEKIDLAKPIDIQKEIMRYTVDITTHIAFGYDGNTLEKEGDVIQDHLDKIFPMINKRMVAPLTTWRYIKSRKDKELDHALEEIRKTIHGFIDGAKKKLTENPELKKAPTNFLEALLVEQENEGKFQDRDVFGNVFTILLAGEDTTSNSISWAIYFLASNPGAYTKLRKEADAIIKDDICITNIDDLAKLEYTEGVINEAMRMKPVGPIANIQALDDIVLNNMMIKKDAVIMMLNRTAQVDNNNFGDAQKFKPERWTSAPVECPADAHNPDMMRGFGAGPRYCPGKSLAFQEMKMALSMIVKNFDIKFAVEKDEIEEMFSFTMYPHNLMIELKPRAINQVNEEHILVKN
jgi:cytochrome P450/nitrite reductase/ring-hydroxylating ferredoxin subunit